ncbi:hypothetical protein FGO68_gene14000 [Halteria grandinella]|uniref:Uncharacterized protein n=1 Tax=Halteria grandinella TaxID=5974 RepID=A0A8J8NZV1_HALGN|nr:hypothetical protein FGO68_gene14000 [Halteria grandinella]
MQTFYPPCSCNSRFPAEFYCATTTCPLYHTQYCQNCMSEEKHNHGVTRVFKICQELREKSYALSGCVGQLLFDAQEKVYEYSEIATFFDKANQQAREVDRTLTSEMEKLVILKRNAYFWQEAIDEFVKQGNAPALVQNRMVHESYIADYQSLGYLTYFDKDSLYKMYRNLICNEKAIRNWKDEGMQDSSKDIMLDMLHRVGIEIADNQRKKKEEEAKKRQLIGQNLDANNQALMSQLKAKFDTLYQEIVKTTSEMTNIMKDNQQKHEKIHAMEGQIRVIRERNILKIKLMRQSTMPDEERKELAESQINEAWRETSQSIETSNYVESASEDQQANRQNVVYVSSTTSVAVRPMQKSVELQESHEDLGGSEQNSQSNENMQETGYEGEQNQYKRLETVMRRIDSEKEQVSPQMEGEDEFQQI